MVFCIENNTIKKKNYFLQNMGTTYKYILYFVIVCHNINLDIMYFMEKLVI